MSDRQAYLRDGAAIYQRSFAIIRAEADLSGFSAEEADVVVRMIHACGVVEAAANIVFGGNLVAAARGALAAGAPILCDAEMVAHGVTRARLPASNEVICTLNDARVAALAKQHATTRSAAAIELWGDRVSGAVVAIGNAPTALFHLLDLIDSGAPKPAAPSMNAPKLNAIRSTWMRRSAESPATECFTAANSPVCTVMS